MTAYASLRQDCLRGPKIECGPTNFIRKSMQRLGSFIDRRRGREIALSRHPLAIAIDSSDTLISASPQASESGDAQSVTTLRRSETIVHDTPSDNPLTGTDELSLIYVDAEKFPHFVGDSEAKLSLSQSLQNMGQDIAQIDIRFRSGQRLSWRKRRGIIELPKAVRKDIWRKAIVHDRKLFICRCFYCQANGVVATQPPLTCTSRSIRAETIPIFYEENIFQHPLAHPGNHSVRGWLTGIGADNRSLLRHLELTFLHTERAIESLDVHYQMQSAKENIVVENVMWDDGQMGEMEWHVFTAKESRAVVEVVEEDDKSIGTSILFDQGEVHGAADEPELETEDSDEEGDWETISDSGESTQRLLAPSTPPQVSLTRKNGEAFGDPRWSFAGKFNDHVVRRLASLHRDPHQKPPRKPVPFILMPSLVVASDRAIDDDAESPGGHRLESSGSWVMSF